MFEPGTALGHYEVLSPLGKGGMGEINRATDLTLGREVAIKHFDTRSVTFRSGWRDSSRRPVPPPL